VRENHAVWVVTFAQLDQRHAKSVSRGLKSQRVAQAEVYLRALLPLCPAREIGCPERRDGGFPENLLPAASANDQVVSSAPLILSIAPVSEAATPPAAFATDSASARTNAL
jgi:hypothetical protein